MNEWKNYGDINFSEYGGTLVRKAFDEEEIQKYPHLNEIYDVFHMDKDGDNIYAFMGSVDINDYGTDNIHTELEAEQFVAQIVDEVGYGGCNAISYHSQYPNTLNDFNITENELKKWLSDIDYSSNKEAERHLVQNAVSIDAMETAENYANYIIEQINVEYPTILPYGLESSGRLNVNDIQNIPTYVAENKYISYTVLDGEKWYYDSCDDLQRLCDNSKLYNKTVMDNPIYGMDEQTIEKVMSQCMEQQGKAYMENYLSTAHHLYETAKENEAKGIPFIMPSEKIAEIIERRESRAQSKEETKQVTEQHKAKHIIERD